MLRVTMYLVAGLLTFSSARAGEGFYSLTLLNAPGSPYAGMWGEMNSVDHIFRTVDMAAKLAATKRVRMLTRPVTDEGVLLSFALNQKTPLRTKLEKAPGVVEVTERDFRPVLKLLADFSNYGDRTLCLFETGAILLIGGDEPEFVVMACFKCHDISIVRRTEPEMYTCKFGISPELETAIFALARKMFPMDEDLQKFQLKVRTRAVHPPKPEPSTPSAPDDPFRPE